MLTLKSILKVTRQQAAFGELQTGGVPRDRQARPRSATASPDPAQAILPPVDGEVRDDLSTFKEPSNT